MNTQLTLFPELPSDAKAPLPASPTSPTSPFASAFDDFTIDQQKQIIAWYENHTYDQTIDRIQQNYGVIVSRSALARFRARTALLQHLEETPDAQAAADEILRHLSDKNHRFTAASLEILEQTAFKLSLTCIQDPSHLDALNRISLILCRQRHAAVRERHATAQEKKSDLRAQELALKEKLVNHRIHMDLTRLNISVGGTSPARSASQSTVLASASPTSTSHDDLNQTDEKEAGQKTIESSHPENPAENSASPACPLPLITNHFSSLPPEVMAENQRHAELLLAGKIKTHYSRDPKNSLLAKICYWPFDPPCSADSPSGNVETSATPQPGSELERTANENASPQHHPQSPASPQPTESLNSTFNQSTN
jgi:hypothetical protein